MIAFVYDLIYTVPLCIAAVLMGHSLIGKEASPLLYASASFAALVIVLAYHLKARGRILIAGLITALIAGICIAGRSDMIRDNSWAASVAAVCFVCFAVIKTAHRYRHAMSVIALAGITALIAVMVWKTDIPRGAVVMLICWLTVFTAELIQAGWKKEGYTDRKKHVVHILPFLIPVMIMLCLVKMPSKPYDWRFFKNIVKSVRTGYEAAIQTLFSDSGWDGSDNIGFSDRAVIGGRVQDEPYTALKVSSENSNDYRIYLGGKVFDTFDGKRWTKTDSSETDEHALDILETVAAVMRYAPEDHQDYFREGRLHIRYEGTRTKYIFLPAKGVPADSEGMVQSGGDLTLKKGKKAAYYTKYLRLNKDSEDFRNMADEAMPPDEKTWSMACGKMRDAVKEPYTLDDLAKYRENIYKTYLPKTELSEKAEKFVSEALNGADSDIEKLTRIEKMLGGYTYTRTPGELPENITSGADYIDYFLFEKREGFCTHYATAFVLLARSQGIPARYVQGYSTLSRVTAFEVMSDRAHAWPEAYIDNVGWLVFEPTPGYRQSSGWSVSESPAAGESSGSVHTIYDGTGNTVSDEAEEVLSGPEDEGKKIDFGKIGVLAATVVLFLILFAIADIVYMRIRYRRMSDAEKVLSICKKNMRMLRAVGYRPGPGETLGEFGERAGKTVPGRVIGFIGIYEKILYSRESSLENIVPVMERYEKECGKYTIRALFGPLVPKFLKKYRSAC